MIHFILSSHKINQKASKIKKYQHLLEIEILSFQSSGNVQHFVK